MAVTLELVTEIATSPEQAFDVSLEVEAHTGSMARSRERAIGGVTRGRLGLGDQVTWRARHFRIPWTMTSKIVEWDRPRRFVDEQVRGPFASFRHEHLFEPTGYGTRMIDRVDFRAPGGFLGQTAERLILGRYIRHLIESRNAYLCSALAPVDEPPPTR